MLTESEIRSHLDEEIRGSVGFSSGQLAEQRKKAIEYYYGDEFGNEVEGRSHYVSRDVADTIEWIMPSLMKVFASGDQIVKFEPQGPEDQKAAEQATDYINYVFTKQNDGFLTLYTWFKDALLSKNGFVKVFYEYKNESKTESYDGLTDDEFTQILQDEKVEPLEHTESFVEVNMGGQPQKMKLHALKVRKTVKRGKCCVVPVPPEEVLVNRYPVSPLKNNRFIAHRRRVTISELKEMGYEDVDDLSSFEDEDYNEERTTRFSFDDTSDADNQTSKATRHVWLAECYTKLDVDEDGIAELRKITMAGDRLLDNEEVDTIPFVTITPIILPHKLFGMSVADLIMDLQLLKSTVFRQIIDNMFLANNGRYMALDGMVNLDDLLTSRPGGIVRVKTFDAVKPMQPPLLGAPAFSMLEYIDTIRENRTGITRYNQGIDANSLNKTASGISQIMGAAQQRTELIARVFAETGVKDLFYAILENVQKHQKQAEIVRLRNEWVPIDPREWTNKFDLNVMVGLGTGNKDVLLAQMDKIIQMQYMDLQAGLPTIVPHNLYQSRMEWLKASGIKGGEMFFTSPDQVPPKPNPEAQQAQAELQMEQQKLQIQAQKAQAQLQQKQEKMERDFQMKAVELQEKARQAQEEAAQEADKIKIEAMIEKAKAEAQVMLEREKMRLQLQLQREKEMMNQVSQDKEREHQSQENEKDRFQQILESFTKSMETIAKEVNKPKRASRAKKESSD